jgi:hypothetical protein
MAETQFTLLQLWSIIMDALADWDAIRYTVRSGRPPIGETRTKNSAITSLSILRHGSGPVHG